MKKWMKKRILALLLSSTLLTSALAGCQTAGGGNIDTTTGGGNIDTTTGEGNIDTTTGGEEERITIDDPDATISDEALYIVPYEIAEWREAVYGKRYIYFYTVISNNPYDLWLESELSANRSSLKELYMNYLTFWENELEISVKYGKELFQAGSQYDYWKADLEQWLVSVQNVYQIESELLEPSELSALAMLISRSQLIRETTIEVKNFLYRMECENKTTESEVCVEIPIYWASKPGSLKMEDAADSVASLILGDLLNYFNEEADRNINKYSLDWQVFAEFHADDPNCLNRIRDQYDHWLYFLELELAFSTKGGERLFDDVNEYGRWKDSIEQLDAARRQMLSRWRYDYIHCKYSSYGYSEYDYFRYHDLFYCPQDICWFRQQVIEIKFFLYLLEYQQKAADNISPDEIEIKWSPKG